MSLAVAEVELPAVGFGYGTRLLGVPGTRDVLLSWIEKKAALRLVRWPLDGGAHEKVAIRGLLRDGLFDGERAHLLTTHGLVEVALSPLRVLRSSRAGLPTYPWSLHALGGERALLGKRWARTALLVELSTHTARRLRVPTPDVVMDVGGVAHALSFGRGEGVPLAGAGAKLSLPRAQAAIRLGDEVIIARGAVIPVRGMVSPPPVSDELFDVASDGVLERWTPDGRRAPLVDVGAEVLALVGPTAGGLLLAHTVDGLVWVDVAAGRVVASHPCAAAGPPAVVGDDLFVLLAGRNRGLVARYAS